MSAETAPPLDPKLIRRLANCMFRAEFTEASTHGTPAERKAAWARQRADYLQRARRLYRTLERDGVSLTAAGDAA